MSTGRSLALAHPEPVEFSPSSQTHGHRSLLLPAQPHSQTPNPSLLARPAHKERWSWPLGAPRDTLYQETSFRLFWDVKGPLRPGVLLGGGQGGWGHWCSPGSPGLPGTDPEEAILSAFRMFDPSGKGVVKKDE